MERIRVLALRLVILIVIPSSTFADSTASAFVFLDTYTAYHGNKSEGQYYFTQAEAGDIGLNLGSVGVDYDDGRLRTRLVGQYGDSVDINHRAEQGVFKYLQEAYLGTPLGAGTTLDVGTFLSHIGPESWVSRNNIIYTRSFLAEFSPYYETGVRLSHQVTDDLHIQLLAINGWQSTTDARHPAFGSQLSYSFDTLSFLSNTFVGEEEGGGRILHDLVASYKGTDGSSLIGAIDVGHQEGIDWWWGYALMGQYRISEWFAINGRIESFHDPETIVVPSLTHERFRAHGASLGADLELGRQAQLRAEVRYLWSDNAVFFDGNIPCDDELFFVVGLSFFTNRRII